MDTTASKNKDASEHSPIYLQTKNSLVKQIENGELKPHDALPSERALAIQFNISRMTARRALVEVEKAGYAYSKDRSGRFVTAQRLSYDVGTTLSFAAHALREQVNLSIEVISTSTEEASAFLAQKLDIEAGTLVHIYSRVFKVDGQTVLIERESAIAERFPELLSQDLRQSSLSLYENHYGVTGTKGQVTIRCAKISTEQKQLFSADTAPYGLEVNMVLLDSQEKPFCYDQQTWCAEMAEFTLLATPS
jgi:GntR family transcriptional regulator